MAHVKITVSTRDSIADLQKAIRQSDDEKQKTRIRAIISIKKGSSRSDVVATFATTHPSLRHWIRCYNNGGTDALKMSKGGRSEGNPVWDKHIFDELVEEINKQEKCWSAPMMQDWIAKHHKKNVPESTVYYNLKVRNMSYKSLRPHPYKGDKEAQEAFKKGA